MPTFPLNGAVNLPAQSFSFPFLLSGLATAMAGDDAGRYDRVQATIASLVNAATPGALVYLSSAQSKAEGNSGSTIFTFTVTRTMTAGAVTVPWTFEPGDTLASDFTGNAYPAGGGVTFADGVATATFSISVQGDIAVEVNEMFTVSITVPNGLIAGGPLSATGTILNDDSAAPAPSLSLSSAVTQAEGNSGTAAFVWTLTLFRDGSTAAIPFTWAVTGNGSNPANAADFGGTFPSGSGTFAAGETTKTITVLVAGDTAVEPAETFLLTVSSSGLASVTSTGTISNDDDGALTVLLIGSSTPARYFTDNTGPANSQVTASSDGTNFTPIGTTGAGATNLGDQLQKATGRPIRFIKGGLGGTQLAEWDATNFAQRTAAINAGLAAGGVDLIICAVGFNDAYQSDGTVESQASHQAKLASLYSRMRSGLGQPNVPIFIMGSQKYTGSATSKPNDMYTWIRAAEIALADAPNNYWYAHSYDLAQLSDGIHQAAASYITHASRGASNILRFLAGQPVERGPRVSAVTPVYTTKTDVTLAHSTGSDFTPVSGITGFEISFDNFATTAAISAAARLSASAVRLTHAASGGAAPAVRAIYGAAPNTTASVHDNSPQALPINPTAVPFVAGSGSSVVDPSTGTPTPTPTPTPSTFTDEFDYANGSTLAANGWTSPSGTFTVQDGDVYGSAIGNSLAPFVPGSATMGVTAPIKVLTTAQGNTLIVLHYQDESNYIWAGLIGTNGKWQIGKTVSGTAGSVATDSGPGQAAGSTYVVDFSCKPNSDGTAILASLVIDGAAIYTDVVIADAALQPKGSVGLRQSSAASTATTRGRFTRFAARSS